MLGWRSSGLSPAPSATGATLVNGDSRNTMIPTKKAPKPSSTAVAYGATSRSLRRVRKRIALLHSDSSSAHSSSEPSCEDHTAVSL